MSLTRRRLLTTLPGALAALDTTACATAPSRTDARVLVVGGGFAGATAARYLARWCDRTAVTLLTSPGPYWTCPFSNTAIAGLRPLDDLEVDYGAIGRSPVELVRDTAVDLDPVTRRVRLGSGARLDADIIVLAPGIELDHGRIEGLSGDALERFPSAWEAGPATTDLRDRLRAVPDGGLVMITAPENPYRCPPGPYERASLMAWWLARHRPRARLVILDAKDRFTKDTLFRAEWAARYPNLTWVGRSDGGALRAVDGDRGTLHTDFEDHAPDLACVIPPQRAAAIARKTGLDGGSGWCPIVAETFASTLAPDLYVIGDAAIANPMPKSAFAANSQGKACAAAIADRIAGRSPTAPVLMNTCYSLVAPDAAISIGGSYSAEGGRLRTLDGSAGVSPGDADATVRSLEAAHAEGWYRSIVDDAFG